MILDRLEKDMKDIFGPVSKEDVVSDVAEVRPKSNGRFGVFVGTECLKTFTDDNARERAFQYAARINRVPSVRG